MIFFPKYRRSLPAMRRLYNRIYRYYGRVERELGPKLDIIVSERISDIPNAAESDVLEYCCGSGLLSLKLARIFKSVTAKDFSTGMLGRARERAKEAGYSVNFSEGNILDIDEPENSYDYVFVSFALHLFPFETERQILLNFSRVARKGIFIIDHSRKWKLSYAVAEWLEGSYYDRFIKYDFKYIAEEMKCRYFEEYEVEDCLVLKFSMDKNGNFNKKI
jgi:ubiquinone/menaquinone biosynthesis C-methylase UbiE